MSEKGLIFEVPPSCDEIEGNEIDVPEWCVRTMYVSSLCSYELFYS